MKTGALDQQAILEAARLTERTFLITPDLYKAVSGLIVERENMGVANIPSFLGADRRVPYFLNRIGLHNATVQTIMRDGGFPEEAENLTTVAKVKEYLENIMNETAERKSSQFEDIYAMTTKFYDTEVMLSENVISHIKFILR